MCRYYLGYYVINILMIKHSSDTLKYPATVGKLSVWFSEEFSLMVGYILSHSLTRTRYLYKNNENNFPI